MTSGKRHGDETKAAVIAALLAGQSVSQVARDYSVSRRAVQIWRDSAGVNRPPVSQEKQDEIGELVGNALRSFLVTVSVLSERTHDETWFREQSAADIAVLVGVLTDKAVRILEAVESAGSEQ